MVGALTVNATTIHLLIAACTPKPYVVIVCRCSASSLARRLHVPGSAEPRTRTSSILECAFVSAMVSITFATWSPRRMLRGRQGSPRLSSASAVVGSSGRWGRRV